MTRLITDYRSLRDFLNTLNDEQLGQAPQLIGSDGLKLYEAEITEKVFFKDITGKESAGYASDFDRTEEEMLADPNFKIEEPVGTVLLFVKFPREEE